MNRKVIAILGGGLTGLSAALYLSKYDYDISIFEKENQPGGLVAGQVINNNIYEYGPHFFHTNNPKILKVIKNIAGDKLISFKRTILIKFLGEYFTYPLSITEVFKKLPKKIVLKAIMSLIGYNLKRIFLRSRIINSENLLLGYYGNILYKLFFKDYIYHIWGIPPKDFSVRFAEERIPKISTSIFLNKLFSPIRTKFSKKITKNFIENVDGNLYTTSEGYRGITNSIIDLLLHKGVKLYLSSEVREIIIDDNKITKILIEDKTNKNVGYYHFKCDGVINTTPVNELTSKLNVIVPDDIHKAAKQLDFRSLVFVGILINKPSVLPVSFMYFREHSFNRIYDSSYFGHDISIKNTTILVAEISSSSNDEWWLNDEYCRRRVIDDLLRENLLSQNDILEINVYRYKYGYPIYKIGYDKNLQKLLDYLENFKNFKTAGRQGLFQYINGHIAIQMGFDAAEDLIRSICLS